MELDNTNENEIAILKSKSNDDIIIDKDNEDELSQYRWYVNSKGYVFTHINRKTIYIQKMILKDLKDGEYITYKDGNKLNNSKSNLIITTKSKISHNRGLIASNTSGVTGVTKVPGGYRVRFWLDNKTIELGRCKTIAEAINLRTAAEQKYIVN